VSHYSVLSDGRLRKLVKSCVRFWTSSGNCSAENFEIFRFSTLKNAEKKFATRANPPCITMGVCVLGGRKRVFEGSVATGGDAL
jgi:hypothetical protein